MSQVGEKVFPEQIMMSHVEANACLYPHVEVLQGTKRSVKESSDKSKKSSPQMGGLSPESARQRFRSFCYHDAPGPYEVISQLQELCYQWLRPQIHSKEQILELLVLEQFLDVLPSHILNWVQKYHPQNIKEAVALVDRFKRESGGISNEVSRKIPYMYTVKEGESGVNNWRMRWIKSLFCCSFKITKCDLKSQT